MGKHSLSGKECGSLPFMRKLESTLCIEKLHVTLSANRRNLKELAISWNGRSSGKRLFILTKYRQADKRYKNLIDRHEYFLQYRFTKNLTIIFIIIRLYFL